MFQTTEKSFDPVFIAFCSEFYYSFISLIFQQYKFEAILNKSGINGGNKTWIELFNDNKLTIDKQINVLSFKWVKYFNEFYSSSTNYKLWN